MTGTTIARLATLTLALLVTFTGPAQATLPDYNVPALKVWGQPPACPSGIGYHWFDIDPFTQYDGIKSAGRGYGCDMWLSRPDWLELRRVERCVLYVHEYGHMVIPGGDPVHAVLNTMGGRITRVCRAWERERWALRLRDT